jgi:acetylglutamate/LysW-gamma-L-alpha-aminoadipate kinase
MIHVLKLGGGAGVHHDAALRNLAARIDAGESWVLVHGASDAANRLAEQVGYPAQTITTASGHTSRYTDARTLEIFCAAAGAVNQLLTARLHALGVNAAGLAGPNILRARRKGAIRAVRGGRPVLIRDDYTGTIQAVDDALIRTLVETGMTPVIAPIALSEAHERLNVDGDLAAAHIARALNAEALLILSNVPGLLRDVTRPESLIDHIYYDLIAHYEGFAGGRMKKKLLAAEQAAVARTILSDSRLPNPIDAALAGAGTQIVRTLTHAQQSG